MSVSIQSPAGDCWQQQLAIEDEWLAQELEIEQQLSAEVKRVCGETKIDLIRKLKELQQRACESQMQEQTSTEHAMVLKQLLKERQGKMEEQLNSLQAQHSKELEILAAAGQRSAHLLSELQAQNEELIIEANNAKAREKAKIEQIAKIKEEHLREQEDERKKTAILEKKKREEWQRAQTTKIREMTIKGLEPELNALITKHSLEMQQAQISFKQQLLQIKQHHQTVVDTIMAEKQQESGQLQLQSQIMSQKQDSEIKQKQSLFSRENSNSQKEIEEEEQEEEGKDDRQIEKDLKFEKIDGERDTEGDGLRRFYQSTTKDDARNYRKQQQQLGLWTLQQQQQQQQSTEISKNHLLLAASKYQLSGRADYDLQSQQSPLTIKRTAGKSAYTQQNPFSQSTSSISSVQLPQLQPLPSQLLFQPQQSQLPSLQKPNSHLTPHLKKKTTTTKLTAENH